MPRALPSMAQDILSLLGEVEPSMLLWREVKARLWPSYKGKYKDSKVFGVALSNCLGRFEGKLWKHVGDFWGTIASSPPRELPKDKLTAVEFIIELIRTHQFLPWFYARASIGASLPPKSLMQKDEIVRELIKSGDYAAWENLQVTIGYRG